MCEPEATAENGAERATGAGAWCPIEVDCKVALRTRAVKPASYVAHRPRVACKSLTQSRRWSDRVDAFDAWHGTWFALGVPKLLNDASALWRLFSQEIAGILARCTSKDPLHTATLGRK